MEASIQLLVPGLALILTSCFILLFLLNKHRPFLYMEVMDTVIIKRKTYVELLRLSILDSLIELKHMVALINET